MKYPCQEGCHSFRTLIEISKRIFFHDSPATCRTKLESETHESLNLRFAICPQQFRRAWPLSARRPGEPGLHLVPNQASPVFPHDESRAAKWLVRPFVTIILSWMIVRVRKSGSPFPQANVVENSSPRTSKFRRSPCPALPFLANRFNPRAGTHCCPVMFATMMLRLVGPHQQHSILPALHERLRDTQ